MKRYFVIVVCLWVAASAVYAATKEQKRLENCGVVLQEVLNIPDNLPIQVLAKAECVIVFPSVLKLAFGMGKDYGRGAMVCRTGKEFNGPWGAPAMYALEGDSIGMQLGGESTDLILLVMNKRGAASILSSKIKLGGDASAAAGPKGRDASANTDLWMRAEILSKITARAILLGNKVAIPATGRLLVRVLQANAPRNEAKQVASR
jgi:lipid-binding SYLF domain-containing protein